MKVAVEYFLAGGIVSWPLLAFSIFGIAMVIERCLFWYQVRRRQSRVIREFLKLYPLKPSTSINLLKQNADLPLARIFLEALELDSPNPEEFRLALESAAQAEIPTLKRFNNGFETIIALSPLLGLLGTVLGLMTAFSSLRLGDVGGTQAKGVTGGISEALISTVMGLVVAIATLMFANTFRSFYIKQLAMIQEYGGQLELLYRRQYEQGKKSYAST
ncbi:MotA/TolQ/ExbB proton channel family protein [Phormidium sp. LEGE 05292]|uniref:MotA/TolQ/ExbB proton channel family protein n=1 Tax=[Phormidium] sp. LEGE 05292 TaxID=767427 RepID=UPI00187F04BC|nr:MotA/TolQ/ExbB proton channel family protein [Phormidium sp. LEGE 05292]MBE9225063.1 MotA/TolQ/ExbB proton channel family protein [Phormidium sp. LEGE 05292]